MTAIEDEYAYNGDGLRTVQTIGGTTQHLVWDPTQRLSPLLSDGARSYLYGPSSMPIEQITSAGTAQYLHHDQQGSTRLITGSTGTAAGAVTYDSYGNTLGTSGSATSPLGYDGQYSDADTGLIYLRARYYDPSTAQFLSVDPAVETTLSPYTYGQGDPVDQTDPSGQCAAIVAAFRDSQKPLTPMEDCEKRREGLQRRYKELLKRYEEYERDDKELKVTNTQSLKEHIKTFNQLAANLASEIKTYRHRKCEQKPKETIPPAIVAMSESKLEIRVVATGG